MKHIINKLRTAMTIINFLPELPGYNGSILTIDDTDLKRLSEEITYCIKTLENMSTSTNYRRINHEQ